VRPAVEQDFGSTGAGVGLGTGEGSGDGSGEGAGVGLGTGAGDTSIVRVNVTQGTVADAAVKIRMLTVKVPAAE